MIGKNASPDVPLQPIYEHNLETKSQSLGGRNPLAVGFNYVPVSYQTYGASTILAPVLPLRRRGYGWKSRDITWCCGPCVFLWLLGKVILRIYRTRVLTHPNTTPRHPSTAHAP